MAIVKTDVGRSDKPFMILNSQSGRIGYEFVSWNTKSDGTGVDYYPNTQYSFQRDITLYAKWKKTYDIMSLVEIGNVEENGNIAKIFNDMSGYRTKNNFLWSLNNAFQLTMQFTTGNDVTTSQVLFRMLNDEMFNLHITGSRLKFERTAQIGTHAIQTNKEYYLKAIKNGNELIIQLSTDGINYETDLTVKCDYASSTSFFAFGYGYSYTTTYTYKVKEKVSKQNSVYVDNWIWHTNEQKCYYRNRNGKIYTYEQKLKHATNRNKKLSNGCGYWSNDSILSTYTTYEYETKEKTDIYDHYMSSFKGSIDFEQTYFIINNNKYKFNLKEV